MSMPERTELDCEEAVYDDEPICGSESKDEECVPRTKEEIKKERKEHIEKKIKHYFDRINHNNMIDEVKKEVSEELMKEYFPEGVPEDLPYDIRLMLGLVREEKRLKDYDKVELSAADIETLQKRAKELNDRQNEIFNVFMSKESFDKAGKNNLCGNLVSEYKKIEGLKANLLDTLQAAYLGRTFGDAFDNHFCETPTCDCNHRF